MESVYVIPRPSASQIIPVKVSKYVLEEILKFYGCRSWIAQEVSDIVFKSLNPYNSIIFQEQLFAIIFQHISEKLDTGKSLIKQELEVSFKIKTFQQSVCILLGGTSGCGKSTLASLLASRLGITTVLSTDNVRHLLRNFISKEEKPVLWTSSYHAGEALDHSEGMTEEEKTINGYEEQNKIVLEKIDDIISMAQKKNESLIMEGVHLSMKSINYLIKRHKNCIPFLIYISSEAKHSERFAIRAKYMTLEPRLNKYIKFFKNIRTIQLYLCDCADKYLVPKINNTNVDRSLAILHQTVLVTLARLVDTDNIQLDTNNNNKNIIPVLHEEFLSVLESKWSSKKMLQSIRENNNQVLN